MAFADAVGREMSGDSLRRITESFGQKVEAERTAEAERASMPAQRDEKPDARRLPEDRPIEARANISTDGAMVLVREEGWKEVKLTAISKVTVKEAGARATNQARPSRRDQDPLARLSEHSYQVGLWDAETLGQHQYAEGLRRGLDRVDVLSSVNDAAVWIGRVTATNFPEAVQIIDWSHPDQRLRAVAQAVFGEQSERGARWVNARLDELWAGDTQSVITALDQLDLAQGRYPAEVQQAAGYFRNNQDRMRYPEYRALGYPIGSGTVESAANTVVHYRMKRPGRGWRRDNAQAMLAGLSDLSSDRFDSAWQASTPKAA